MLKNTGLLHKIFVNRNLPSLLLRQQTGSLSTFTNTNSIKLNTYNVGIQTQNCKVLVSSKSQVIHRVSGCLCSQFCTNMAANPIATYEEVKDLPNHPEKLLIDVREPHELQETGKIPTSINIPLGDVERAFSDNTSSSEFERLYGVPKPKVDDYLILSCRTGRRMANVEEELKLPSDAFKQKYKREKPNETTEVIFHCLKGGRAQRACDTATGLGYKNARNFKGSWTEWAEKEVADLETELNLSSDNFREKYGREKPSKTNEIMFHCSKGGRGQKACDAAIAMGFVNARNYKGGWNEWAEKESLSKE
uniref:CSON008174 protein n=1 Tax=Culicoides sonorensis TaxID=179676 RepID=A0A336MZD6_CULSO